MRLQRFCWPAMVVPVARLVSDDDADRLLGRRASFQDPRAGSLVAIAGSMANGYSILMENNSGVDKTIDATFAPKDYLVLLPLLASAIALTYDVCYFSAFDVTYFTFFSLSEHIVFALQALPFCVAAVLILALSAQLALVFKTSRLLSKLSGGRRPSAYSRSNVPSSCLDRFGLSGICDGRRPHKSPVLCV